MQLEVTADARALAEATKMMRRWHYWPRAILQGGYFFLLLGVMIWGTFFNLISSHGSMQKAGLCAVVSAVLIAIRGWHGRCFNDRTRGYQFVHSLAGILVISRGQRYLSTRPSGIRRLPDCPQGGTARTRDRPTLMAICRADSGEPEIGGFPRQGGDLSLRHTFGTRLRESGGMRSL